MVEAGTGTGKSIAYLVPSILWAMQNNERVVISTNTINLQEQLIDKDIPTLRDALEIPFSASVMKGRGNYLCPRRLGAVRRQGYAPGRGVWPVARRRRRLGPADAAGLRLAAFRPGLP